MKENANMRVIYQFSLIVAVISFAVAVTPAEVKAEDKPQVKAAQVANVASAATSVDVVADPNSQGGEAASVIQVANLIYAGTKTSECFADHFLRRAEQDSAISTSRRLHSVNLASAEV